MSRRTTHGVALVATALSLLITTAGCGSSSSSNDATATASTSSASTSSTTAATAQLPASIKQKGVLEFASDIPYAPFEYYDGNKKLIGFDVDLADAIAKKLGVTGKFVQVPFDSIVPALQAKKYPLAMTAITDTKEREQVVDFVDYMYGSEGMVVPKGNPEKIAGPADLCGKAVAVTRGTTNAKHADIYAKRCVAAGKPTIKIDTYQSDPASYLAVQSKKADAAINSAAPLGYLAKTVNNGNTFEVVQYEDKLNPRVPVGIAVARDQAGLKEAIAGALKSVIASGEYQKLAAKWGMADLGVDNVTVNEAIT